MNTNIMIDCICGKTINQYNYIKHINSKYHNKRNDPNQLSYSTIKRIIKIELETNKIIWESENIFN